MKKQSRTTMSMKLRQAWAWVLDWQESAISPCILSAELLWALAPRLRSRARPEEATVRTKHRQAVPTGHQPVFARKLGVTGLFPTLHHLVNHDVRLVRGRWAYVNRLVRHFDMQRISVGIGINRHRRDAHAARGAHDAAGDLAAVGYQDLLEHLLSFLVDASAGGRGPAVTAGCCRASSRGSQASCRAACSANG